jgi:hypothetical protein
MIQIQKTNYTLTLLLSLSHSLYGVSVDGLKCNEVDYWGGRGEDDQEVAIDIAILKNEAYWSDQDASKLLEFATFVDSKISSLYSDFSDQTGLDGAGDGGEGSKSINYQRHLDASIDSAVTLRDKCDGEWFDEWVRSQSVTFKFESEAHSNVRVLKEEFKADYVKTEDD